MAKMFLDSAEQGIVVFKIWKSLPYKIRILLGAGLVLIGLFVQLYLQDLVPGVAVVFIGNLFLLPRGFDNRVKIGTYKPKSGWEQVAEHKLTEFLALEKKIRRWDKSAIDISNGLGFFTLLILLGVLALLFWQSQELRSKRIEILVINAAVLFIPFWFTGLRSTFTMPDVTRKIKLILKLLSQPVIKERLKPHDVDHFFLLGGKKDTRIPLDVKFRVNINDRHKDFLGLYGQIVLNHVQSTPYPYFYVVLVAKKGFGLEEVYKNYLHDPRKLVKEYKVQEDVEVLVIRQNTRMARGYYTKEKQIVAILLDGLQLAEKAAKK